MSLKIDIVTFKLEGQTDFILGRAIYEQDYDELVRKAADDNGFSAKSVQYVIPGEMDLDEFEKLGDWNG